MDPRHILTAAQAELGQRGGFDPSQIAHLMSLGIGAADVHIDAALSGFAVGYANEEFIADDVCPVVMVRKESDKYWIHDTDRAFNTANVNIASQRGRPGEVNTTISTTSYATEDYGLMGFVPQSVVSNADAPLDPEMMEVETIMNFLLLARERRAAALLFAGASYGVNTAALAGTDQWTHASSDPANYIENILDTPKVRPNVGIIGYDAVRALRSNAKFVAYIQSRASTEDGPTPLRPTNDMIARAFGLDRVYVPKARYNTANFGQTSSLSRIWESKTAAFIRVEPRPNIRRTGTFAYTFRVSGPGESPMAVQKWFDRVPGRSGGTWVKVTHADDEKLIAGADGGYLLTTVIP